jgi:hypothetical protein
VAPRIENDQARFLRPLPVRDPNRKVGDLAPGASEAGAWRASLAPGASGGFAAVSGGRDGLLPLNRPATGFTPVLRQMAVGAVPLTQPGAGTAGARRPLFAPGLAPVAPRLSATDQEARPAAAPQNLVDLLNEVRGRAAVVEIARQNAGLAATAVEVQPTVLAQVAANPVQAAPVADLAVQGTVMPTPVAGAVGQGAALPATAVGATGPAPAPLAPDSPASVRTAVIADDMRRMNVVRFLEEESRRQAATRTDQAVMTPPLRMVIDTAV